MHRLMRDIIPGLRSNRGNAMIEFALIAPLLLTMVAGVIDYGLAIYSKMRLTSAVRPGVQYALANPTNNTGITTVITSATSLAGIAVDTPVQTCECADTSSISCTSGTCRDGSTKRYFLTIAAHYAFSPLFPAVSVIPSPLSTTTIIRTK